MMRGIDNHNTNMVQKTILKGKNGRWKDYILNKFCYCAGAHVKIGNFKFFMHTESTGGELTSNTKIPPPPGGVFQLLD